jgi:porin
MQLVGGQTTFLYNVTLEKFFNDGDWSVKFGRMTATDDFVGSPLYSYSLNNAVNGQIRAVLFDGVMTSYPFAVWGGRVKAKLSDDTTFQFGAFQMTPEMWDPNNHGLDMGIGADDGVELMAQLDWTPTLADKPARFFVGVNQAVGLDLDRFNSADTQEHLTRFFGHAQYQIYRPSPDSDQGLTAFATLAYSPDESVAIIPLQTTFGLNYKGLFPNRPADHTVFFLTYGKFSKDYSDQLVAAGNTPANYEMVVELGHRFQVTASSYIQLDAQWINRPGGTGDVSDAIVLGSQFGISF